MKKVLYAVLMLAGLLSLVQASKADAKSKSLEQKQITSTEGYSIEQVGENLVASIWNTKNSWVFLDIRNEANSSMYSGNVSNGDKIKCGGWNAGSYTAIFTDGDGNSQTVSFTIMW
jgi:predicted PhzF superfamily epimerase YddE/YHI9